MENLVGIAKEFFRELKKTIKETQSLIGKKVIDSDAQIKGIIIDVIKNILDQKVSILGVNYSKEEIEIIETFDEDVVVIQGKDRVFIPYSDISAIGSVVLLKRRIDLPEIEEKNVSKLRNKVEERLKKIVGMLSFEKILKELSKKT